MTAMARLGRYEQREHRKRGSSGDTPHRVPCSKLTAELSLASTVAQVRLLEGGRVLPCFMAAELEYEGQTYAALYPVDAPVSLATMTNERLTPLDQRLETESVVTAAAAACAENDKWRILHRTCSCPPPSSCGSWMTWGFPPLLSTLCPSVPATQ